MAATVLAVFAAALAAGGPAQAQTPTTVVSNHSQSTELTASSTFQAQNFVAGSSATITEIRIRITTGAGRDTKVVLRENKSNNTPGDEVATFINPASFTNNALNTFTASSDIHVVAGTTYWVTVNEGISSDRAAFSLTSGDGETGETGWSIGDGRLLRSAEPDNWSSSNHSLKMSILGTLDTTGPQFVSGRLVPVAAGDRADIFLTFDESLSSEALDYTSSDFSISVDGGTPFTPHLVLGRLRDISITSGQDLTTAERVVIEYTPGNTNFDIQDVHGNRAGAFTATVVAPRQWWYGRFKAKLFTSSCSPTGAVGWKQWRAGQGCFYGNQDYLDPNYVTVGGGHYYIRGIYVQSADDGTLTFEFGSSAAGMASRVNLGLILDGETFWFADATASDDGRRFVWTDTGLSWEDEDVISYNFSIASAANLRPVYKSNTVYRCEIAETDRSGARACTSHRITADDPNGDTLTYSLDEGDDWDEELFRIDNSGRLFVKSGVYFDYEDRPPLQTRRYSYLTYKGHYWLRVKATDPGGLSATRKVAITLLDNELEPESGTVSSDGTAIEVRMPVDMMRELHPRRSGPTIPEAASFDVVVDGTKHAVGSFRTHSGRFENFRVFTLGGIDPAIQPGQTVRVRYHSGRSEGRLQYLNPVHNVSQRVGFFNLLVQEPFSPQTISPEPEPEPMTLEFRDFPAIHDGVTNLTFELVFGSAPVDATPARIEALLDLTGATLHEARRAEEGNDLRWIVELTPTAEGHIFVSTLPAENCEAAHAICNEGGVMPETSRALVISYEPVVPVVATFVDLPANHDGETAVVFELAFEPAPADLTPAKVEANLTVENGTIDTVSRIDDGSDARWRVTVTPSEADSPVAVTVPATADCGAANALCTERGGKIETEPAASIPYAPPLTVAYTEDHEPPAAHNGLKPIRFRVSFSEDLGEGFSTDKLRRALEIAQFSSPFLMLTPTVRQVEAGQNQHFVVIVRPQRIGQSRMRGSIRVGLTEARGCASNSSICTADGRRLSNTLPVRTLPFSIVQPIAATFSGMPATHDGETALSFELAFAPEPEDLTPATVEANLTVTNGAIGTVSRVDDESDARWSVTVTPSEADSPVAVTVPATTDCEAENAICTAAGGKLETGIEHSIAYETQGQQEGTPAEPIVATFVGMPATHDGETAVVFELAFAPEPADLTPAKVEANLTVENGAVETASRIESGSDARWRVSVAPTTGAALGLALNATVDCALENAICTEGGGKVEDGIAATVAYAPPLTVAYVAGHEPPASHDGSTAFKFQFRFSEAPRNFKSATMREHSLAIVQGGSRLVPPVEAFRRIRNEGYHINLHWEVTVTPGGNGDISIALGPTGSCDETGAMCTADGRPLSNALPATTVSGRAGVSVADAEVVEAEGAMLDFVVTLSRAVSETVTMRYGTRGKTAKAGLDYYGKKGTLTIPAGETAATVSVEVRDDSINEGSEYMELWISRPSGGDVYIGDGTARGTITNDDPMPHAWLARFGRTVAGQAVDAIGGRFDGGGGTRVTVGGQSLDLSGGSMTEEQREELESALGALAGTGEPSADTTRSMTGRELLLGSAFHLSAGGEAGAAAFTAWGRFATGGFDAEEDGARMDGSVTSGFLGADVGRGHWLAGLAVGLSEGDGTYAHTGTGAGGEVESTMTALYPYARVSVTERLDLWGLAGFGQGELEMTHGHEDGPRERFRTDLGMRMGAVGARGEMLSPDAPGGLTVAVKSDAFWVRTTSDAVRAREGVHGNLAAAEADATRLRLILEGSRSFEAGGGELTPSLELGLRQDGGDAETGTGVEAGASLRYAGAGVSVEGSVRTLLTHEAEGYREWGASGAARIDPGESGRGLSLTLAPTWGAASSGAERLWGMRDTRALSPGGEFEARRSFETELGYGLGLGGLPGTVTPYAGLSLREAGARAWRTGARWAVSPRASVSLEGTRSEAGGGGAEPEQAVTLRGSLRW